MKNAEVHEATYYRRRSEHKIRHRDGYPAPFLGKGVLTKLLVEIAVAEPVPSVALPERANTHFVTAHQRLRKLLAAGLIRRWKRSGANDVWPELSCAIGDALHNLRLALDHIAYAVALERLLEEKIGHLYFTIRPTLGRFRKSLREEPLSLTGAGWEAFVLSVQPFQVAPYTDLARISELDNIDKHRLMFSLTPRSDVHSWRPDGQWDDESLGPTDGLCIYRQATQHL